MESFVPRIGRTRSCCFHHLIDKVAAEADKVRIPCLPNRRKSGQATVVVFLLVPQVRLRKRLNVDAIAGRQAERVPSLIARHV